MLSAFCFLPGAESISRQAFCRRVSAFCFLPYRKQIARLGHEKAESFLLSARCNQRKQRPCFLPDICLQISGRENGVIDIFLLSAFCFLLKRSLGRENGVIDIFLLSAFCFLLSAQISGRENGVIDIFLLSAFCFLLKRSLSAGRTESSSLLSAFCFLLSPGNCLCYVVIACYLLSAFCFLFDCL